ncbi:MULTISPECIES: cbb3-type cytochrome c oxidase N-terminal domain-containing protein [Epilithonimonas]|uniref:Cytochrome c oxidase cbb3-type subunit 3 n=1 Tax=Epilithonimonas hungarica TaxID=454006 RepID=A0A1G7G7L7_9FLAO|nr:MULTISPECIES: cbb3-type cytochrome c oxidase N-terminal domain-containing protein [Epilithonimonas]MPS74183.1 c-type cytochrome [Chryseobacterium sp.]MPT32673.1 c-type cytochrome [Chryseobacterium sp.]SDE84144.1 cytochrome c oxidase cbb3-type subunit 3 [Epilithonimonas hungarica]
MKRRTPVYINILIVLGLLLVVFYMFSQTSDFLSTRFFLGTALISIIVVFIQNAIGDLIENEKFKKLTDAEKATYLADKKIPYFQYLWNGAFKSQSEKEEKDILIDHGFDGIMELDNQLPKWWLGLFYFGCAYCVLYVSSYFLTDFAHPYKEYEQEYREQTAAINDYMATVTQPTLETAVFSEDNVEAGKAVFETNCVSCHGEGGKGGIGPNLTDNFWINQPEKTLFKNVFYMVDNGSKNNPTMQAWGKNGVVSGFDMQNVAAYVYHINQEQAPITPAQGGAAPQGTEAHWEKSK